MFSEQLLPGAFQSLLHLGTGFYPRLIRLICNYVTKSTVPQIIYAILNVSHTEVVVQIYSEEQLDYKFQKNLQENTCNRGPFYI